MSGWRQRQSRLLAGIARRLEAARIPYWLESGTLLGAVREGDHLASHPRVDLAVDAVHRDRLLEASRSWRLPLWIERGPNRSGRRWLGGDFAGLELVDVRDFLAGTPVRAWLAFKEQVGEQHHWVDFRNCKWAPSTHFDKLEHVVLDGRHFPAPGNLEAYLALRYGDWRRVRPDWISQVEDGAIPPVEVVERTPVHKRRKKRSRKKRQLTGRNADRIRDLMLRVIDLLEDNGIPYWVEDGTLLGIVRDGDLIPWDDDADLAIPGEYAEQFASLRAKLLPRYVMWPRRSHHPWIPGSLHAIEVHPLVDLARGYNFHVDVYAKYRVGDRYQWIDSKALKHLEPDFYDDLETLQWRGRTLRIPADVETYLERRYGDWRTSNRDFDTSLDDPAIAERGF